MIITRYICRQILLATAALTLILLVVVMLGRLLNYLVAASQGELDPDVLALILAYRIPDFLQLILPLALLLGILLALGRLYAESELVVLHAAGMSRLRLLAITGLASLVVMLGVAWCSLSLAPSSSKQVSELLEAQQNLSEFDLLAPGLFQQLGNSGRTSYSERVEGDQLQQVFMFDPETNRVIKAETAETVQNAEGERFVLFKHGTIVEGLNTGNEFAVTLFDGELGLRLPPRKLSIQPDVEEKTLPTRELLKSELPTQQAELQWRLSLIVLVPVLVLLAIPLSRVSPRQGRFARLVPAILLYMAYLGLLLLSRDWLAAERLPSVLGLLWVHVLFVVLGVLLFTGRLPLLGNRHG
jgi:lipopolysaccharide export system permease protein